MLCINSEDVKIYVKEHSEELFELHKALCLIPAPSHLEEKRAAFCKAWFDENCGEGAYIDEANNVIFPYRADDSVGLTVLCAHTDTVFPDTEPMPLVDDGDIRRCPGAGDDTAALAVLMLTAKYFAEYGVETEGGVLFLANSCEEGLGNLKGTRAVFSVYGERVKRFVTYDASFPSVATRSVGSHRYLIEVSTEGGHSWGAFGNKNAINELAGIVREIYSIELPEKEGSKVTFNAGTIEGGTSVNTIAQSAKMLCEYRSDDKELLSFMETEFARIFKNAECDGVSVKVTRVGDRPCMGDVDPEAQERLIGVCAKYVEEIWGEPAIFQKSSTDANIPLSLGIPAIAAPRALGGGVHTREEWVSKSSMLSGLELCIRLSADVANMKDDDR